MNIEIEEKEICIEFKSFDSFFKEEDLWSRYIDSLIKSTEYKVDNCIVTVSDKDKIKMIFKIKYK